MDDQFWDRIERDGLLTRNEVNQARARYAAAGGAPDTAIGEVRSLSGDERARLRRILARTVDQPIAPPAFLDTPEPEALALLPTEWADRHSVLAARITPQLLTVVSPAVPARVLAELSFVVGRKVQPYVALESDIRHALHRHLSLAIPPRFQTLGAPAPTPPPMTSTPPAPVTDKPSDGGQREVDRGWGAARGGVPRLRSLDTPAGGGLGSASPLVTAPAAPASLASKADWVARALESVRALSDEAGRAHALGHVGAPGMVNLLFLTRSGNRLTGYVASHGGAPLEAVAEVSLDADVETIVGRALLRGATRCGPFREDAAFSAIYGPLSIAPPVEVLVAPIKRGDEIVGVFVGDHAAQTIAPVTASAMRRLLAGLGELFPQAAESSPPSTAETLASTAETDVSATLLGAPSPAVSRPTGEPAAVAPGEPGVERPRRSTAEFVSMAPSIIPPPELDPDDLEELPDEEGSDRLPEWELPAEPAGTASDGQVGTLIGMPTQDLGQAPPPMVELFTPAEVAEMARTEAAPPQLETRPGLPVLATQPMLAGAQASRLENPNVDTTFDLQPMALSELATALAMEAAQRPTETLGTVAALPSEPAVHSPRPQLLDLDHMETVPALSRLRPVGDAPGIAMPEPAATTVLLEAAPGTPLPAPVPEASRPSSLRPHGWTDEMPVPVVTAVRAIRIEAAETEVDLPAFRFRSSNPDPAPESRPASASLPSSGPPEPPLSRTSFTPVPFDPPSGPMPRVTVTLTPAPTPSGPVSFESSRGPSVPPMSPGPSFGVGAASLTGLGDGAPIPAGPPDAALVQLVEALGAPEATTRQHAEDRLLAAGESALGPVFDAFPGTLLVDRFAQPVGTGAVESHSALLKVVIRLGPLAVGRLEQLCAHLSPEIRYYAVFCFSTLRSPRSLPVLAERLGDSDTSVRDCAVWVLDQYRGQVAFKQVVTQLRAAMKEGPARRRRPLVEAAGHLHLAEALPELIILLTDLALGLQEPAHKALQEIARTDLGLEAWKWQKWFERNSHRPRIEWLLDGLLSDHRQIRAGAFQELRRITHQNYGYIVDAPPSERRGAHDRWMKWWREVGMQRFAGLR